VPTDLPGPSLIDMDSHGMLDAEFDGQPWSRKGQGQSSTEWS
jgi:hypothetical protein